MRAMILAVLAALSAANLASAQAASPIVVRAGRLGPPNHLDLSDDRADVLRPYARTSTTEDPIDSKTAVDHRFGSDGLVGQAGYLCGIGGIGPDNDGPRGGPASAFEHFGTFLGASVGYAFR